MIRGTGIVLALGLAALPASAQDDFEIQVEAGTEDAPDASGADELGSPVADDPRAFEASVHLEVGIGLADEGQCELAIPRFRRVLVLDPLSGPALLRLGGCLHAVGRHAEAVPVLESWFAVTDAAIDPAGAEVAARVLERARAASAALLVVVEPAGALVTVDGRPLLGEGERSMRIDPGRHVIRAELSGFSTEVSAIEVSTGERAWQLVHLERRSAYLEIDTDPADAVVSIDGQAARAGELVELAPGLHRVSVSARDHARRERDVVLGDGDHLRLDVALVREHRDPQVVEIVAIALGVAGMIAGSIGIGVALAQ